jgi:alpha-tubulin suppressor-like RCC1 family protein
MRHRSGTLSSPQTGPNSLTVSSPSPLIDASNQRRNESAFVLSIFLLGLLTRDLEKYAQLYSIYLRGRAPRRGSLDPLSTFRNSPQAGNPKHSMNIKLISIKTCLLAATLLSAFPGAAQTTVTGVAAGFYHSLVLKSDGSLWAMGYNFDGELGDGTYNSTSTPEQIVAGGVTAIATGDTHSLFIKSDGSLWAMGENQSGQLGDGTLNDAIVPEQIVASNVTAIAAGDAHSLFLMTDGSLWAMGDNQFGQLGDGTTVSHLTPEKVVASEVQRIAAGGGHSLYITRFSTQTKLWVMGDNSYGELGDGTTNNRPTPVNIVSGNGTTSPSIAAVAAGNYHSLFLKGDGSLWAMGENQQGELGDGTGLQRNAPREILSSNVTAIAAGDGHSLFLKNDGSLWGMGADGNGQLGDPGFTDSVYGPEEIFSSGVVAISAGGFHSFFIQSGGILWGMGDDTFGQLGDRAYNSFGVAPPELILLVPPTLAITTYNGQPVVLYPVTGGNFQVQMTTNLASSNWVTVSNGVPFMSVQITNAPGTVFFRLH